MFSPALARPLAYSLSIGFLLIGPPGAATPAADPGREVLPANDGWAVGAHRALPLGTTGGSKRPRSAHGDGDQSRNELIAALAWPDADAQAHLREGHDRPQRRRHEHSAHLPATTSGRTRRPASCIRCTPFSRCTTRRARTARTKNDPFGGQEDARAASAAAQAERVHIRVPPNTTILRRGRGRDAGRRVARHRGPGIRQARRR